MSRGEPHRRRVDVVTVDRSDWGLYLPILRELRAIDLLGEIIAIDPARGDGEFPATEIVRTEPDVLNAGDLARRHGGITRSVGGHFDGSGRPPLGVLLLGDRLEMHAAAVGATITGEAIAHVHGGEVTTGSLDNFWRYSVSAMASLHFVATPLARDRLIAMGEEPGRVILSGAPGLDGIADGLLPRAEWAERFGAPAEGPFLLVTHHATPGEDAADAIVAALEQLGTPAVVTAANADEGGAAVNTAFRGLCGRSDRVAFVESFGPAGYRSAMKHCAESGGCMVGNSSSGIIEAMSFGLPVVNIGERQAGRERSANVVDCAAEKDAIVAAVGRATSGEFRAPLRGEPNIYGRGEAGRTIARALAAWDGRVASKRFTPPALRERDPRAT